MSTEELSQDQNIIDLKDFKDAVMDVDTLHKGKAIIQQFIDVFSDVGFTNIIVH